MVEDIFDLFNELSIANAIVCGHSMGGKVAMNFALSYPEKVNKLIVADMGVKEYPLHNDDILEAMLSIDFITISSRNEVEAKLDEQLKNLRIRQWLMKNIIRNEDSFAWKPDMHSIKTNFKNIFCGIPDEKTFKKPALFLRGEFSDYVKDSDLQNIQRIFPNASFITVPKATHWLHADNPGFFVEKVLEFSND